jgi:hypothetical protein
MTIQTGYSKTIAQLQALTSEQRADKSSRQVEILGKYRWFTYYQLSTATPNNLDVITPNDGVGRWIANEIGDFNFGGATICTSGCAIGGKAFQFYAPQTNLELELQIGFDISVVSGSKSIQIHKWSETPNTNLTGRQFAAELPHTGGRVKINIDNTFRWISIFAKNPVKYGVFIGAFDGVCFTVTGSIITLISYA